MDPIRLHVFADPWGINPSPFCLKVETYCRLAGIAFEAVATAPFLAPRGKLPFMGQGRERVPDSGLIIERLNASRSIDLDRDLNAEQKALAHLIRRCCEESLYFVILHDRWANPTGWAVMKPVFFGSLPPLVRDGVANFARRSVRRALHGQGYGRHTPEQVFALGAADLSAIATMLGTRRFAVTDHPTSSDATLYAFLANILCVPLENALKDEAKRHANLVGYIERMSAVLGKPLA